MAKVKGVCKNIGEECSKALGKEVQLVEKSGSFVCEECKKPLIEVKTATSKPTIPWKLIILIALVVVAAGAGVYYMMTSKSPDEVSVLPDTTKVDRGSVEEPAKVDTVTYTTPKPVEEEEQPIAGDAPFVVIESGDIDKGNGVGTISFSYGKYKGEIKNSKADGQGEMQYFKAHRLNKRDSQQRMSEPADVVRGLFKDNEPVNAKWYNAKGEQKGALIVGNSVP